MFTSDASLLKSLRKRWRSFIDSLGYDNTWNTNYSHRNQNFYTYYNFNWQNSYIQHHLQFCNFCIVNSSYYYEYVSLIWGLDLDTIVNNIIYDFMRIKQR